MKKKTWMMAGLVAGLMMISGGVVLAKGGMGPGMGQEMGRCGRGGGPGLQCVRALVHNPELAEAAGISTEQVDKISEIAYEAEKKNIMLRAAEKEAHLELRHAMMTGADRADVLAAVDAQSTAEAAVKKAEIETMLDVRDVIGKDAMEKLQKLMREGRSLRKGNDSMKAGKGKRGCGSSMPCAQRAPQSAAE